MSMSGTPLTIDTVAAQRAELWDAGYRPLAVYGHLVQRIAEKDRGKRPKGEDWQLRARLDPPEAAENAPELDALNTGILCDGLRALDLDVDNAGVVAQLRALAFQILGEAPVRTRDNSPRCLLLYAAESGEPAKRVLPGKVGKIEVLGRGQQFVGFGYHPSGALLRWQPEAPTTFSRTTLPAVSETQITAFLEAAASVIEAVAPGRAASDDGLFPHSSSSRGQAADPLDVAAALAVIPNDGAADWEWWNKIGMATWGATSGSMSGFAAWAAWSERHASHDPAECRERWLHYRKAPPDQIGAGSLFKLARDARPGWSKPTESENKPDPTLSQKRRQSRRKSEPDDRAPITGTVIRVIAGELHKTATEGEAALIAAGLPVYQRGHHLVRPVMQEVPAAKGRMTIAASLVEVTLPNMVDLLCGAATWEKFDARTDDWVRTNPPKQVAETILSRIGVWSFCKVIGVVTTPTIRPDGSILSAPGYDAITRLYHAADPTLRLNDMAHKPTRTAAERGLGLLRGLLAEFPFVGGQGSVSEAVALSALISPVVRGALPVVPMHVFRASTAGTGKSYLADTSSAISSGRPCPVAAAGPDEAETEKRLAGLLLAGFPLISLDNINGEMGGDLLCQAIERPLVRLRPLGRSEIVEVESRASVFGTGNGLRVRGDMTRRTLISDLDAERERPELREFKSDPVATVLEDRGLYVSACLAIVRAYIDAGKPGRLAPIASFADWSDMVRSALVWLGCADPADSMEQAREDDPELAELREIVEVWKASMPVNTPMSCKQMAEWSDARPQDDYGHPTGDYSWPDLRELLSRLAGERGGTINTNRLGARIRKHEGRIVQGCRIIRDTATTAVVHWRLEHVRSG